MLLHKQICQVLTLVLLLTLSVLSVKEKVPGDGVEIDIKDTEESVVAKANPESDMNEKLRLRAKEDLEVQRKIKEAMRKPEEKKSDEEQLRQQGEDEYKLRLLATQIDRNADKIIDLEELSTWAFQGIRDRGTLNAESLAKLKGIFKAADVNPEDDLVSWREVVKGKHRYSLEDIELFRMDVENGLDISFVSEAVETIDDDHKRFELADEDGDELLDMEEMAAFLHPYDFPRMHEAELDRVIKEHDTDKDQLLELIEFLNDKEHKKTDAEIRDLERQFKVYDVNEDEYLDRKEVRRWILPNPMEVARREAGFMMQESDRDGDGALSYRELLDNHEFWAAMSGRMDGVRHYKDEL